MLEVKLTSPVTAINMANLPEPGQSPAGSFTYLYDYNDHTKIRGMIYTCPCGCGRQGSLSFRPPSEDDIKYKRATWDWDGNIEQPTLHPSIHHVGHWHGWLKSGVFTDA